MPIPNINNHQDKGSNNTDNMPTPNPIKHIAIVFFKNLKHISLLPPLIYYITKFFSVQYLKIYILGFDNSIYWEYNNHIRPHKGVILCLFGMIS